MPIGFNRSLKTASRQRIGKMMKSTGFGAIYRWRASASKNAAVSPESKLDPAALKIFELLENKELGGSGG